MSGCLLWHWISRSEGNVQNSKEQEVRHNSQEVRDHSVSQKVKDHSVSQIVRDYSVSQIVRDHSQEIKLGIIHRKLKTIQTLETSQRKLGTIHRKLETIHRYCNRKGPDWDLKLGPLNGLPTELNELLVIKPV